MILMNLTLRTGRLVAIQPGAIVAISEDEDGYAYVELASGTRYTTDILGSVDVETGELEIAVVEGVQIRRSKTVTLSAAERLRTAVLQAMEQLGQRMGARQALAAPRLAGIT